MHTSSLPLPAWHLGVGPADGGYPCCAEPELTGPGHLLVEYEYTPPRALVLMLPNGDPGDEPEEREELTILRIAAIAPLHFSADDNGLLLTLTAGRDLREYFTEPELVEIELALLKQVRADHDEARIDAYLARQP